VVRPIETYGPPNRERTEGVEAFRHERDAPIYTSVTGTEVVCGRPSLPKVVSNYRLRDLVLTGSTERVRVTLGFNIRKYS